MSDDSAWTRDHDRFKTNFRKSEEPRWSAARALVARGHTVTVPPMKLAETRDDAKDCVDNGDLYICTTGGLRIEIKQRGFPFTCAKDFKYSDFSVCAQHQWDLANPKPYAFFIMSQCLQYAGIVYGESFGQWRLGEKIRDSRYEAHVQNFYFCPKEFVTFIPLIRGQAA